MIVFDLIIIYLLIALLWLSIDELMPFACFWPLACIVGTFIIIGEWIGRFCHWIYEDLLQSKTKK